MMPWRRNLESRLAALDRGDTLGAAIRAVTDAVARRNAIEPVLHDAEQISALVPERTEMLRAQMAEAEAAIVATEGERDALRATLKAKLDRICTPARLDAARQVVRAQEMLAKAAATIKLTERAYRSRQLREPLARLRNLSKADAVAALDEHNKPNARPA